MVKRTSSQLGREEELGCRSMSFSEVWEERRCCKTSQTSVGRTSCKAHHRRVHQKQLYRVDFVHRLLYLGDLTRRFFWETQTVNLRRHTIAIYSRASKTCKPA